jgi:hypothetical protein
MGLLARALRMSGPTNGKPPYSSRPSPEDVVPMVPDLVRFIMVATVCHDWCSLVFPLDDIYYPRLWLDCFY